MDGAFLEHTLFNYHMATKNQIPHGQIYQMTHIMLPSLFTRVYRFLYFACSLFEVSDILIDVGLIF